MDKLNDKDRTVLLTKLGIMNAKGLKEGRKRYLKNKVNTKVNANPFNKPRPNNRLAIAIKCIDTGETFASQLEAATAHKIRPSHLSEHLRGQHHTVGGKKYQYITYPKGTPVERPKRDTTKREVRCIDDGQVFASQIQAAAHYGIATNSMSLHLRGIQNNAKGKRFEYV